METYLYKITVVIDEEVSEGDTFSAEKLGIPPFKYNQFRTAMNSMNCVTPLDTNTRNKVNKYVLKKKPTPTNQSICRECPRITGIKSGCKIYDKVISSGAEPNISTRYEPR